jgi:hypothetical protein
MLSSKAIAALDAATAITYGMGDRQRREGARKAVNAAAEELRIDPLAPSLPRFAAGEDVLRAAALRVLTVPGLEKTLERHRAQVAACEGAAARIAGLVERRAQLVRIELGRMDDQIKAAKAPGPPPAEAVAERAAIDAELALLGEGDVAGKGPADRVLAWVPSDERRLVLEAVAADAVTVGSVVFYGALVVERLRVLTEDEHYKAPATRTAQRAAAEVAGLVKSFNYRKDDAELYRTARAVRVAVELADLHRLQARQAFTVEQLDAARSGG